MIYKPCGCRLDQVCDDCEDDSTPMNWFERTFGLGYDPMKAHEAFVTPDEPEFEAEEEDLS